MKHQNRRQFITQTTLTSSLICTLDSLAPDLLSAQAPKEPAYDLLIRGGRVIDPAQNFSKDADIGIAAGKITRIAPKLDASQARQVLDARGKIVTPGLVDIHVHVYDGVAPLGIPADPNCIAKGVTTVLDAGSAGAHTFPGLKNYVIRMVDTRVYALLNISVVGQSTLSSANPYGELLDLRYVNPQLAIRTIEENRDAILGVKIRLSRNITGPNDLRALALAREAADAVRLPLMVHIGDSYSPVPDIVGMLKEGDVITHSFRGGDGGIIDQRDRVLPQVRAAVERGVLLDVGHGAGGFSFRTAEKVFPQGFLPGTISSDVHQFNVNGPVFDLATTLSKFLLLRLNLEEVVRRATSNPAKAFKFPSGTGSLGIGSVADIAVFDLREGAFEFVDSMGEKRLGHQKFIPLATVKAGRIYGNASVPVVSAR
jgi:dihydroorotase